MEIQNTSFYLFENFILDIPRKSLWRAGNLVSLTPKSLDILLVLIKYRGLVVEKDTLLSEVWVDTFVEEATLAQNISTLRRALGSAPGKHFIETIPRRGYRFVMEVREAFTGPGEPARIEKQIEKTRGPHPSENRAIDQIDVTEINDSICLVDISMKVQAIISNNKKYLISVSQCGGDWVLQMKPIKNI